MYHKKFYKKIDKQQIEKDIKREGFNPLIIHNSAGDVYSLHQHPETKLLVFLQGSMDLNVNGQKFRCLPGDKVLIPGNMPHSAVVGDEGCIFFWSEKII